MRNLDRYIPIGYTPISIYYILKPEFYLQKLWTFQKIGDNMKRKEEISKKITPTDLSNPPENIYADGEGFIWSVLGKFRFGPDGAVTEQLKSELPPTTTTGNQEPSTQASRPE